MKKDKIPSRTAWVAKVSALGELESFDPKVFSRDASCPQEVCDFVLALALAHNDVNDLFLGLDLCREVLPSSAPNLRTKLVGVQHGISLHLARDLVGVLHELMALIADGPCEHAYFESIVSQMPPPVRASWLSLREVSAGKSRSGALSKFLVQFRNNLAFHYNGKSLRLGFLERFVGRELPLASRGNGLVNTRFYFSDAAVEQRLLAMGKEPFGQLLQGTGSIANRVAEALYFVVVGFINRRGGFAPYVDDGRPMPDLFGVQRRTRRRG
jgi:hypothetical protein